MAGGRRAVVVGMRAPPAACIFFYFVFYFVAIFNDIIPGEGRSGGQTQPANQPQTLTSFSKLFALHRRQTKHLDISNNRHVDNVLRTTDTTQDTNCTAPTLHPAWRRIAKGSIPFGPTTSRRPSATTSAGRAPVPPQTPLLPMAVSYHTATAPRRTRTRRATSLPTSTTRTTLPSHRRPSCSPPRISWTSCFGGTHPC